MSMAVTADSEKNNTSSCVDVALIHHYFDTLFNSVWFVKCRVNYCGGSYAGEGFDPTFVLCSHLCFLLDSFFFCRICVSDAIQG